MVTGSAAEAGGCGFDPRPCHSKDVKNGTSGYLAKMRSAFIRRTLASLHLLLPPPQNKMTSMIEFGIL